MFAKSAAQPEKAVRQIYFKSTERREGKKGQEKKARKRKPGKRKRQKKKRTQPGPTPLWTIEVSP